LPSQEKAETLKVGVPGVAERRGGYRRHRDDLKGRAVAGIVVSAEDALLFPTIAATNKKRKMQEKRANPDGALKGGRTWV